MHRLHYVRIPRPGRVPRWYIYAWRGGPRIAKIDMHQKPVLMRKDLEKVFAALDKKRGIDPTTLLSLIREWRSCDPDRPSSPEWAALAASTKRTWGGVLDLVDAKWGALPLDLWNDPRMADKVVEWRDSRASTPRGADIGVAVLRSLLEFGCLRGRVAINVASNIPTLYRNDQRPPIIWTDDDIERFATVTQGRDRIQVLDGLRLAALTGLRREELVTLTWDEVGDFGIAKPAHARSNGKRRQVTVPVIPALNDLLEELRSRPRKKGVSTVLVNSYGEPWSSDGFGGSFNRIRDEAEIFHLDEESGKQLRKHLHDLRGTFCTKLMTIMGANDREIADLMGWSLENVSAVRRLYVDQSQIIGARGEPTPTFGKSSS